MTVLVRNETSEPWIFDASAGRRQLAPGEVQVISDDEWGSIITAKRGQGKINALWPAQTDLTSIQMEHFQTGGAWEVRYIGVAPMGSLTSSPVWTVKQLSYAVVGGENAVVQIQSIEGAIWDNRAALGWT